MMGICVAHNKHYSIIPPCVKEKIRSVESSDGKTGIMAFILLTNYGFYGAFLISSQMQICKTKWRRNPFKDYGHNPVEMRSALILKA